MLLYLSMRRPCVTWSRAEPTPLALLAPRVVRWFAGVLVSILPSQLPAVSVGGRLPKVPAVPENVIVVTVIVTNITHARLTFLDPRWDVPGHGVVDGVSRRRLCIGHWSHRLIRAATSIWTMIISHLGHRVMGIMGMRLEVNVNGGHLERATVLDSLPCREPRV